MSKLARTTPTTLAPAQTLRDVLRSCDPDAPLTSGDPRWEDFSPARGDQAIEALGRELAWRTEGYSIKPGISRDQRVDPRNRGVQEQDRRFDRPRRPRAADQDASSTSASVGAVSTRSAQLSSWSIPAAFTQADAVSGSLPNRSVSCLSNTLR